MSAEKPIQIAAPMIGDDERAAVMAVLESGWLTQGPQVAAHDGDTIAGMVNAYGRTLRNDYGFSSDSNGYWRFRSIAETLAADGCTSLQVLTHPEWWTPEPLPPRARVLRAVLGRADRIMADYDALLATSRRDNLLS